MNYENRISHEFPQDSIFPRSTAELRGSPPSNDIVPVQVPCKPQCRRTRSLYHRNRTSGRGVPSRGACGLKRLPLHFAGMHLTKQITGIVIVVSLTLGKTKRKGLFKGESRRLLFCTCNLLPTVLAIPL